MNNKKNSSFQCLTFYYLVKNKILYRRKCLIDIQSHVRMRLVYKRYAPR
jgi:hypothetical protein